jgi:uncharacterized protein with GYD domain
MPKYLIEANLTLEGVRGIVAKGGSVRKTVVADSAKSVGGTLESFYFAFGGTDVFVILDLPDNEAAAAVALTVGASGGVSCRTTVLLTPEEVDAATKKSVSYKPPGG